MPYLQLNPVRYRRLSGMLTLCWPQWCCWGIFRLDWWLYIFGKGTEIDGLISQLRFDISDIVHLMSFKASGVFPSNPVTTRGMSTKISSYRDKVVYTNGKTVIVRLLLLLVLIVHNGCWYIVGACCVDERFECRCCLLDALILKSLPTPYNLLTTRTIIMTFRR